MSRRIECGPPRTARAAAAAEPRGAGPPAAPVARPPRAEPRALAAALSTAVTSLPEPLLHRVFSALLVDERARCACVCRAWRAALASPELWSSLDLTPAGCHSERVAGSEAALRGGAARAAGTLTRLVLLRFASTAALCDVVASNAGSLREITLAGEEVQPAVLQALTRAAPRLRVLEAGCECEHTDLPLLLRAEPPLGALRLHSLVVHMPRFHTDEARDPSVWDELADASLQPTLASLELVQSGLWHECMARLADAVVARRLQALCFRGGCEPCAVGLARIIRGGALTTLAFMDTYGEESMYDRARVADVQDALRASTTLTCLHFSGADLFFGLYTDLGLLEALVGHPSLRRLAIYGEHVQDRYPPWRYEERTAGIALGAIIAADAPALKELVVSGRKPRDPDREDEEDWEGNNTHRRGIGDKDLRHIAGALPRNTHLRFLDISHNRMSAAFERDTLLPAVRANTGLRVLDAGAGAGRPVRPAVAEALELLCSRPPAY